MNTFPDLKQCGKGIILLLYATSTFFFPAQAQQAQMHAQQQSQQAPLHSNAHLGFLYPLSTNGRQAAQYSNAFSFHLLMGLSKEETAFVLSGISTVIKERAAGVQFAGVSNHVGHRTEGIQFAGLYNHTGQHLQGFQFAGAMNYAGKTAGFQFAGLINKAHDVEGFQFAGLINKADRVKGMQFAGLINIADSSDYPVAVLNFIKQGEKSIGISTDELFNLLMSFRSGGRVLYGILDIGYNLKSKEQLFAFGGGLGAHLAFSDTFRLNAELKTLMLEDFHRGEYVRYSLNILPSWKLSERIEVFAGPSLNFADTDMAEGKALFKDPIWEKAYPPNGSRMGYVGGSAGMHFIL